MPSSEPSAEDGQPLTAPLDKADPKALEISKEAGGETDKANEKATHLFYAGWTCAFIVALYFFLFGLAVMGDSFKALSGKGAGALMGGVSNPVAGLMVGIVVTVLLQSSSTTTSIVTSMVGAGILGVKHAIPVIMGANIGTSVTNTLIAHGQITNMAQFQRAFAGATVHDMFNMLSVIVLLPLEIITDAIGIPILFSLTEAITEPLSELDEQSTFESPIKTVVSPLSKAFIEPNKDTIKILSIGCVECVPEPLRNYDDNFTMPGPLDVNGTEWCEGLDIKHDEVKGKIWDDVFLDSYWAEGNYVNAGSDVCYDMSNGGVDCKVTPCYSIKRWDEKYTDGDLVKGGFLLDLFGSGAAAVISLVISLLVLCAALYVIVYALQKIVMSGDGKGKVMKRIGQVLEYNYLAMLLGMLLTICVQSSSIITSTLTPLVGLGAITLEQMLPLTLGANIGTTCTAFLASLVSMKREAIQIALCHLFFNIFGILIWFPIPMMRRVPLGGARHLGVIVTKHPWFGMFYVFYAFVTIPLLLYGFSTLFDMGAGGIFFGVVFTVAIIVGAFLSIYKFEELLGLMKSYLKKFDKDAEVEKVAIKDGQKQSKVVPLAVAGPVSEVSNPAAEVPTTVA